MSLEHRLSALVSAIGADIKALFAGKQDALVSGTLVGDILIWNGTAWAVGTEIPRSTDAIYVMLMDADVTGVGLETYISTTDGYFEFTALLGHTRWASIVGNQIAMSAVIASATAMSAVIASTTAMTAVAASTTAMSAVIASATAMSAVAASTTAMSAVAASATAMSAVIASATAMSAVWASNTATDAVFASATARLAVYNADTALAALQANPTQVQRKVTSGAISGSTASESFTYVANGTKVILLRVWTTNGSEDLSLRWGRGLTTDDVAGSVRLPNGDNLGVATAAIGRTTTYTDSGTYPGASNANANVVSAANGLRRGTWSRVGGTTQNVSYILV